MPARCMFLPHWLESSADLLLLCVLSVCISEGSDTFAFDTRGSEAEDAPRSKPCFRHGQTTEPLLTEPHYSRRHGSAWGPSLTRRGGLRALCSLEGPSRRGSHGARTTGGVAHA